VDNTSYSITLRRSDGLQAGTAPLLENLHPWNNTSLAGVGNLFFFGYDDGFRGEELWAVGLSRLEKVFFPLLGR
jgi:hypothetical protein